MSRLNWGEWLQCLIWNSVKLWMCASVYLLIHKKGTIKHVYVIHEQSYEYTLDTRMQRYNLITCDGQPHEHDKRSIDLTQGHTLLCRNDVISESRATDGNWIGFTAQVIGSIRRERKLIEICQQNPGYSSRGQRS